MMSVAILKILSRSNPAPERFAHLVDFAEDVRLALKRFQHFIALRDHGAAGASDPIGAAPW